MYSFRSDEQKSIIHFKLNLNHSISGSKSFYLRRKDKQQWRLPALLAIAWAFSLRYFPLHFCDKIRVDGKTHDPIAGVTKSLLWMVSGLEIMISIISFDFLRLKIKVRWKKDLFLFSFKNERSSFISFSMIITTILWLDLVI